MTCDEFQRWYLAREGWAAEQSDDDVAAAGDEHLRVCADCQRMTPELDVLRARLGDPAVWEYPGPELRSQVVGAVVGAARPKGAPRWSVGRWWMAGAAAALVIGVVAASLLMIRGRADGADWELSLYANESSPEAVVQVHGWNTANGTHLRLDVAGVAPAGPNEYYAIWMTSPSGQHVSAGTFRQGGRIEAWSGVRRSDFPRIWITLEPDDGDERLSGTTIADTPGW
jgi:Anti-sigma-K factor rskA